MIAFKLTFETDDPTEIDELTAALRSSCSTRTQILHAVGTDPPRHRLIVFLHDPLDDQFQADLAGLLTASVEVIHRIDPGGHWHLTREPGKEIG